MLNHLEGMVRIWHKQHEHVDVSCLVSTIRTAIGDVTCRVNTPGTL